MNKPGHINSPLDSAVWAELNNWSGIRMESIIINFYSLIDFHSKFCQVNRGISDYIENYSAAATITWRRQGLFLPDSKCHGKQSNHILKVFLELSFLYARVVSWFLLSLLVPKTEENFPTCDLNVIFWTLLINWDYYKVCRAGLPHVFIMPSSFDYRGSTADYPSLLLAVFFVWASSTADIGT